MLCMYEVQMYQYYMAVDTTGSGRMFACGETLYISYSKHTVFQIVLAHVGTSHTCVVPGTHDCEWKKMRRGEYIEP